MSALVLQRVNRLAGSLAELKVKVRAALATELASAVGTAVRDVLVIALLDRITTAQTQSSRPGGWREDEFEDRDRWGDAKYPWAEPDDDYDTRTRHVQENDELEPLPAVPAMAAVAVGVNVGRWWLARHGTVPAAVGFGVLATMLGLTGGPFARAALAVLAAATDLLTAESTLARLDPS
jgi:hypothetical protein